MFKQILKYLLISVLVFIIGVTAIVFLSGLYNCNEPKTAEAASTQDTNYIINPQDYPTFNLLRYPMDQMYTDIYGLSLVYNRDGSFTINGTATATFGFYRSYYGYDGLTVGNYSFSTGTSESARVVMAGIAYNVQGESWSAFYGLNGTFYYDGTYGINVILEIASGTVFSNVVVKPTFNKSDTVQAFSPAYTLISENLTDIITLEYNLGVLYGLTADIEAKYGDGTVTNLTGIYPDYSYNSINFDSYANSLEYNSAGARLQRADIVLTFKSAFSSEVFPLFFVGSAIIMENVRFTSSDGVLYSGVYDSSTEELYPVDSNGSRVSIIVSKINIWFGGAGDNLYDFNLVIRSNGYGQGYEAGYNNAISINDDYYNNGYNRGVSEGYDNGYEKGYNVGYAEGVEGQLTAGGFFSRVLDILDVKIFGFISIADILMVSVGAMLVLLALKIFAGG